MWATLGVSSPRMAAGAATLLPGGPARLTPRTFTEPSVQYVTMHRSSAPVWGEDPTATAVVDRKTQVKHRLDPSQKRRTHTVPSCPCRSSVGKALMEARVIFSGRWWQQGSRSSSHGGVLLQPGAGLQVLQGQGKGNITACVHCWPSSSALFYFNQQSIVLKKQHEERLSGGPKYTLNAASFLFHWTVWCLNRKKPLLSLFTVFIPSKYLGIFQPQGIIYCVPGTHMHAHPETVTWTGYFFNLEAFVPHSAVLIHYLKSVPRTCILKKKPWWWSRGEGGSGPRGWMKTSCWAPARISQCF